MIFSSSDGDDIFAMFVMYFYADRYANIKSKLNISV